MFQDLSEARDAALTLDDTRVDARGRRSATRSRAAGLALPRRARRPRVEAWTFAERVVEAKPPPGVIADAQNSELSLSFGRRPTGGRRDDPHAEAAGFWVKALYTVPELATLIGMHHQILHRWLAKKVPLLHVGASVAVLLLVFGEAFPDVWQSVKTISELHRGVCPVCGDTVDP